MKTVTAFLTWLKRDLRERWEWYRVQRREPVGRHWWDAYHS